MEARKLDWDSDFFGMEIFSVGLPPRNSIAEISELIASLRRAGADLVYFFLQERSADVEQLLMENGGIFYDEKLTYYKELTGEPPGAPKEAEAYEGNAAASLLELAFLAGHESRFRKDPRLSPYFESMYELWMVNSLNGTIADKVFVYRSGADISGMVTCKVKDDNMGNIGLIATAAGYQGKGIGQVLLQAVDRYFGLRKVKASTVVTQRSNIQACRFYEKAGFAEYKTEYVFHLWFNRSL